MVVMIMLGLKADFFMVGWNDGIVACNGVLVRNVCCLDVHEWMEMVVKDSKYGHGSCSRTTIRCH